ncbi:MAG TPA: acyl-CoA dehydrogenase family protein [Dehalococcoidia bacterium]|nr:acyl-CoA dehydrogenase family protein [Dehalococcoidia bacterium]
MDFASPPHHEMIRQAVRQFFAREWPRERLRQIDQDAVMPPELREGMGKLGWFGMLVPPEYGGTGSPVQDVVVLIEEVARHFVSASGLFILGSMAGRLLARHGTEAQKRAMLPRLVSGQGMISFGITEPSGGTDALALTTSARRDGDEWVVNGQKVFTSMAHYAEHIIALARTNHDVPKRAQGISLIAIPMNTPGVEVRKLQMLGWRSAGTNEVFFSDVRVPVTNLIGEQDRGFYHLLESLNNERITCAAISVGIARAAFEDALAYAKERHAFGRPIGQFQSIQHYLAEMATDVDMARLLTQRAAWLQDNDQPCHVESGMAKYATAEIAVRTCDKGMRILGGYGFTLEYDMQRYLRDSRLQPFSPVSNEMVKNLIGESLGLPRSF